MVIKLSEKNSNYNPSEAGKVLTNVNGHSVCLGEQDTWRSYFVAWQPQTPCPLDIKGSLEGQTWGQFSLPLYAAVSTSPFQWFRREKDGTLCLKWKGSYKKVLYTFHWPNLISLVPWESRKPVTGSTHEMCDCPYRPLQW